MRLRVEFREIETPTARQWAAIFAMAFVIVVALFGISIAFALILQAIAPAP